jgi:hypothetical protein
MATITLPPPNAKYTFSILTNIFKQALADTDADTFDYVCCQTFAQARDALTLSILIHSSGKGKLWSHPTIIPL